MIPESTDTRELVDLIIFVEKIFEVHVPDDDIEYFCSQGGTVHWLKTHLADSRSPSPYAAELLIGLSELQRRPRLAEGLDSGWRLDQIVAIIDDVFLNRDVTRFAPDFAEFVWLHPPQGIEPHSFVLGWRRLLPTNASIALFGVLTVLILLYRQFLA